MLTIIIFILLTLAIIVTDYVNKQLNPEAYHHFSRIFLLILLILPLIMWFDTFLQGIY